MSWSLKVSARRFAVDGELAAAFRSAKSQAADVPASLRAVALHERTVQEAIQQAPHDCDITVQSYGHFSNEGLGTAELKLAIGKHVAPAAATP